MFYCCDRVVWLCDFLFAGLIVLAFALDFVIMVIAVILVGLFGCLLCWVLFSVRFLFWF